MFHLLHSWWMIATKEGHVLSSQVRIFLVSHSQTTIFYLGAYTESNNIMEKMGD